MPEDCGDDGLGVGIKLADVDVIQLLPLVKVCDYLLEPEIGLVHVCVPLILHGDQCTAHAGYGRDSGDLAAAGRLRLQG